VGLGRESCGPDGPRLSPLNVSRPSASNGHAWIPAEQNAIGALALTLGFIRASSRHAPQLAPQQHRHGPSHRCTHPSMGGRVTVEWLLSRALPAHRSERATTLVGRRATRRRMAPPWALSPARVPARLWVDAPPSSGSSAGPYPHSHGGSRARCHERRLEMYPRGSQIRDRRWFARGDK
jgi:hypothetical protein